MARPLLTFASVCSFLILVLAAAGISMLDLVLTDEPGAHWEAPFEFVRSPLWIDGDPDSEEDGEDEEGSASRYRVTCTEADGQVREFLLTGDRGGEVLELHLFGSSRMEVESVDDGEGPDTDLSREWE